MDKYYPEYVKCVYVGEKQHLTDGKIYKTTKPRNTNFIRIINDTGDKGGCSYLPEHFEIWPRLLVELYKTKLRLKGESC